MQYRRPVLVTGSHRSGSTWVGKMLSLSPSVGYIREPFSVLHRPGILEARFPYWFPYICSENEEQYLGPVRDMLAFRYKAGAALRAIRSPKDLALMGHDVMEFSRYRRRQARPLLKDPIAVLSAAWLGDAFGMQVIALVRHPAAFASSLMRYGWTHPFDHFLKQPLLMRDLLGPFEDEIMEFASTEKPIIDQAILLWNVIHHALLLYHGRRADWRFFRHEDIGRDPVARFREMFAHLDLPFEEGIQAKIAEQTDSSNPSEAAEAGVLKRDSRAAIHMWKTRLSPEQIRHIRERVEAISANFYSDSDW